MTKKTIEVQIKKKLILLLTLSVNISLLFSVLLNVKSELFLTFRLVSGFIYITFIPGLLIVLVIFRNRKIYLLEIFVYSIGISLIFWMMLGYVLNFLLSTYFNVLQPLTVENVLYTSTTIMGLLILLIFKDSKNTSDYTLTVVVENVKRISLFNSFGISIVLISLSIIGTFVMNSYQSNIIMMLFIIGIVIAVLLLGFTNAFQGYGMILFGISVSLLYHRSLITNNLVGWDIFLEYYFYKITFTGSKFNPHIYYNMNAMLSLTVLPTIYSKFLGIGGVLVYKVIYPFLYSVVPLSIYAMSATILDRKDAFLATTFFVFSFSFYIEMTSLMRQLIAEIFLSLILLTIAIASVYTINYSRILMFLFSLGIIVSHYGLGWLYLGILITSYFILILFNRILPPLSNKYLMNVQLRDIFLYFSLLFIWYTRNAASAPFNSVLDIASRLVSDIMLEFFDIQSRHQLVLLSYQVTYIDQLRKLIYLLIQISILGGYVTIFKKITKNKGQTETKNILFLFSLWSSTLALWILSIILPEMAHQIHATRLFHISMIFLTPLTIFGIRRLVEILSFKRYMSTSITRKITTLLAICLLVLDIGLVNQLIGDPAPRALSLSMVDIDKMPDIYKKAVMYNSITTIYDISGAKWLKKTSIQNTTIYSDSSVTVQENSALVFAGIWFKQIQNLPAYKEELRPNSYIYLRYLNVRENIFSYKLYKISIKLNRAIVKKEKNNINTINKDKIYDNSGCQVFYVT